MATVSALPPHPAQAPRPIAQRPVAPAPAPHPPPIQPAVPKRLNSDTVTAPAVASSSLVVATPPPATTPPVLGACSHLTASLSGPNEASQLQRIRLAVRYSVKLSTLTDEPDAKRRKMLSPRCTTCNLALSRPVLCLECGSILCGGILPHHGTNHAKEHAIKHRHTLFWDLRASNILCMGCSDYVYNTAIERLIGLEQALVAEEQQDAANASGHPSKRKHVDTAIWKPVAASNTIAPSLPRGLKNLGQTCYMSVILQAFLHIPVLRVYFLSDRHNRALCERSQEGQPCLSCEMDHLFSECCSSNETPFGPTNFLFSIWQSSTELSGYAQQDAHEFLISALNLLHSSTPGNSNAHCTCIVHTAFAGQLRSEVRCGHCGNVTHSTDPFLDLSLDLRGSKVTGEGTLAECLSRFTSPEILPPKEYTCGTCGDVTHTASKQLSIHKAPPVLCIQLKRFEHMGGSHKVDTPIRYPLRLNLKKYMSTTLSQKPKAAGEPDEPEGPYEYELNSLVAHEGSLTNGHYTSICRGPDDFWAFDDDKTYRAPLNQVLKAKAYLLVYTAV